MRKCKIGIVGFGTVGKGIYRILKSKNDSHPILKDIEIVGIAVKNINKKRDIELENIPLKNDPYELIDDPNVDVIIEVKSVNLERKRVILNTTCFCSEKKVIDGSAEILVMSRSIENEVN